MRMLPLFIPFLAATGAHAQLTCAGAGCDPPPPVPASVEPLAADCQLPGTDAAPCPTRPRLAGLTPLLRDPRPVVLVNCMNGNRENPRLWAAWWDTPDTALAGAALLKRLENCHRRGFRRIVLYMPAGQERAAAKGALFASSQYWSLPCSHRDVLRRVLTPWLQKHERDGEPVTLGVYGGSYVTDDVACLRMAGAVPPDLSNADHVRKAWLNIDPWTRVGIREYWLDHSATKPCIVAGFQSHPAFTLPGGEHVRFGGEAIPPHMWVIGRPGAAPECGPQRNAAGQQVPDERSLRESPWVCTLPFAQDAYPAATPWRYDPDVWKIADPSGRLKADDTELGMIIQDRLGHDPYRATLDDAARMFLADPDAKPWTGPWRNDAGWVLWAGNEDAGDGEYPGYFRYLDILQRIYDIGPISAAPDYNADGRINDRDLDSATAAVRTNQGARDATYLMGDFDGDGVVEQRDLTLFRSWWRMGAENKRFVGRDLGPAGP